MNKSLNCVKGYDLLTEVPKSSLLFLPLTRTLPLITTFPANLPVPSPSNL